VTPEGGVIKAILDLLAAEKVPAFRMNSGAVVSEHQGKKRMFRFGQKGMADVLAMPAVNSVFWKGSPCGHELILGAIGPLWIEAKAPGGKQSPAQKEFQQYVTQNGMSYLVARSSDDVLSWIKQHRIRKGNSNG
jgi:hypothetical protein